MATRGKVVGRSVGDDGFTYGTYKENPYHMTVVYAVQLPTGKEVRCVSTG